MTTPSKGPVFVVGCGRSGTTLLRVMLTSHSELAIAAESHFMVQLIRRCAIGWWPARALDPAAWDRLVRFVCEHRCVSDWGLDRSALRERLNRLNPRSLAALCQSTFAEMARQQGKLRWGDKTPQQVQYLLILGQLFPDARFVHIIRDARDCALSLVALKNEVNVWGPRFMGLAGSYWKWLVLSGLTGGALLGTNRYFEVKYEDLVLDAEGTLRRLCAWLGLEFEHGLLRYFRTATALSYEAVDASPAERRIMMPPDATCVHRWKTQMSPMHRRQILRQAGGLLAHLGYEVDELPSEQLRVKSALDSLFLAGSAMALAQRIPPPSGDDCRIRIALGRDRLLQVRALATRQVDCFVECSIRWQRGVNCLLGID